jgi:hypothetical protein
MMRLHVGTFLRALLLRFRTFEFAALEFRVHAGVTLRKGHLYKYKSLDGTQIDHVIEIVRDSRLYFPRPSQLNDPEEGKPRLVVGNVKDPTYWPAVEAWVRRCVSHRPRPPTEAEIQAELAQLTQERLDAMVCEAEPELTRALDRRYRIFSLADSPWNRHLWERYAGNGVCLEFHVESRFGTAFAVEYSDQPRYLDLVSYNAFDHLVKMALIKARRWREERECRIIFGEPPIDDQPELVDQRYAFPADCLTGMLIGYKVSRAQQEQLLSLARARRHPVRCYLVRPIPWSRRVWLRRLA